MLFLWFFAHKKINKKNVSVLLFYRLIMNSKWVPSQIIYQIFLFLLFLLKRRQNKEKSKFSHKNEKRKKTHTFFILFQKAKLNVILLYPAIISISSFFFFFVVDCLYNLTADIYRLKCHQTLWFQISEKTGLWNKRTEKKENRSTKEENWTKKTTNKEWMNWTTLLSYSQNKH